MKDIMAKKQALDSIERNLDLLVKQALKRNPHYADRHLTSMKNMLNRVNNDGVKATASFHNMKEAQKITYQTLFHHLVELDNWLEIAYPGEQKSFSWIFPTTIGYGCFRDDEEGLFWGTKKCKVVVEKKNSVFEFAIVTSIPWMDERFKVEL